ncbi:MAG: head GIN domain-containing protein [Bacteroidota bacterium]
MKNTVALLMIMALSTFSYNLTFGQKLNGKGDMVTRTLNVDDFTGISLSVNGKVYITKGPQSVKVKGQANIIDNLELDVDKNYWNIEFDRKVRNYKTLEFYISMPDVTGLSIAGSGKITSSDTFENIDELRISIAGSGDIDFRGSAEKVKVSIAGSGDANLEKVTTGEANISIAGSGDAYIHAREALKVSIAGSGDVHYKGRPKIKTSIAGSGSIESIE